MTKKRIEFEIPGPPHGKGRPRFGSGNGRPHVWTPDKTAAYESLVRGGFLEQCGRRRVFGDDEPLAMNVTAFFGIQKSTSAANRQKKLDGEIRPAIKPDVDNIFKAVADSLNGVAYKDDSRIVTAVINKLYGETPKVCVEIMPAESAPVYTGAEERLLRALEESIKLQNVYATHLNLYDGGNRRLFSVGGWMAEVDRMEGR
jgi:Holliday junction resolvase RusA-like endonuclease